MLGRIATIQVKSARKARIEFGELHEQAIHP